MTSLLIVSPDFVDSYMAGPGMRSWEIAREMSRHFEVTLAVPNASELPSTNPRICTYDASGTVLTALARDHDAILVQGFILHEFPFLKDVNTPIIVDLYDPFIIENLEVHSFRGTSERERIHVRDLGVLIEQLKVGDFFICASEHQWDYWLGALGATGRINPYNYRADKSLRRLIDVVPFGLPNTAPTTQRRVLKGVHPGISANDKLLLWGGGIWPWFDPLTIIQAVAELTRTRNDVRLFFLGKNHPNPRIAAALGEGAYARAVKLSKDLGLYNRQVFFNDRWVIYGERHSYLLEADVGISLHKELVEMRFASRTRLLDCIWCGLPILCSRGGEWAEFVEQQELGKVVGCGKVGEVVDALKCLLDAPDLKERLRPNFARAAEMLTWSKAVNPLIEFLRAPSKAPDKVIT